MSWQLAPQDVRVSDSTDGITHLWGLEVACTDGAVERSAYCFIGRASLLSHEPDILDWTPSAQAARIQQIACDEVQRRLAEDPGDDLVLFL